MTPGPIRPLTRLLRIVLSPAAATAAIGDLLEELEASRTIGRGPRYPALWINLQVIRAILRTLIAAVPHVCRVTGLILRDAIRAIRAAPAHSAFVASVLAAGITLATVTFSVVDAVVLAPLPIEHPERVIGLPTSDQGKPRITHWQLHDQLTSVETVASRHMAMGVMITVNGVTDEGSVARVGADMFRVLRLSPGIGRLWTAEEAAQDEPGVAVLGYRFWREQLGGDPSVLGKTVTLSALTGTYTVIGVLSAASDHPEVDLTTAPVWIPDVVPRTTPEAYVGGLARMRPGVSTSQVADEIRRLAGAPDWHPDIRPLLESYVADIRHWMLLALGAAALVVLVACANAANLMLTRSVARAQEMAVRSALGASRRQIALGVLAEGLLLSAAATATALVLSIAGVRLAKLVITASLPSLFRVSTIALSGRVLIAAMACAVVTGVLCSLVPAWQTSRTSVSTLLKDSDAPTATGRRRWRSAFLTSEIASVVVLVAVSWLFVTSFLRVISVDLGIDRTNLLAVSPRLEFRVTVDEVRQRVERVPGVVDVAVSTGASLPLIGRAFGGAWGTTTLARADRIASSPEESAITTLHYNVTSNYFAVAGMPFQLGGTWPLDEAGPPRVVVLDEQAARHLFSGENPIGREVRATRPAGVFTVIGTVPHVYARGAEDPHLPSAYFPLPPNSNRTFAKLFVKTQRPPEDMRPVIAAALEGAGPDLKEPFVFAADEAFGRLTATRRFLALLMSVFGIVGTLIGMAGVYAVMASFVAQQTREIGVRLALGATRAQVRQGVLRLAGRHLLMGLALGVPLAWWLSRGFAALLFQVAPTDGSVYAGVAALLGVVGLLAAWIPARRAAKVDPIICLRR